MIQGTTELSMLFTLNKILLQCMGIVLTPKSAPVPTRVKAIQ